MSDRIDKLFLAGQPEVFKMMLRLTNRIFRIAVIALCVLFAPGLTSAGGAPRPATDDAQRVELISQSGGLLTGAVPLADGTILAAEGDALIQLAASSGSTQVLARRDLGHGQIVDLARCGESVCALTVQGIVTLSGAGGMPGAAGFAPGGGQALAAQGDLVVAASRQAGLRLLRVGLGGVVGTSAVLALPGEALDVALDRANHRAYVAAGEAGVIVVDVNDPPSVIGVMDAVRPADSVGVVGRLLAVGSGRRVLLIDPASGGQTAVGAYAPLVEGRRIIIQDDYAYVADAHDGLKILWLAGADRLVQAYGETGHSAVDVAVSGDTVYVVGPDELRILDISSRYRPLQVAGLSLPAAPRGITLADTRAFIALGDQGIAIVDVSNQSAPRLGRVIAVGGLASASTYIDGALYVAAGDGGLVVINANDPGGETLHSALALPGPALDVAPRADAVYVAAGESGLISVDVTRRYMPVIASVLPPAAGQSDQAITIFGKRAYIAQGDSLSIADVSHPGSMGLLGSVRVNVGHIAANDIYLYALGGDQVSIYDARATAEPVYLRTYRGLRQAARIAVDGVQAFITSAGDGPDMIALDLSTPDSPYELDNIGETGHTYHPDAGNGLVLLPAGLAGLRVYRLTEGGALAPAGSYSAMPDVAHLAGDGSRLLAGGQLGWSLADLATGASLGSSSGSQVRALAVDGDTAALASGDASLALVSLSDPARLRLIAGRETSGPASGVALDPGFVYAAEAAGLAIYDRHYLAQAARIALPSPPDGLALGNGVAYLPLDDGTLAIIDLGDPAGGVRTLGTAAAPRPLALIPAPDGTIYGLADTDLNRLALGNFSQPAAIRVGGLPQVGVWGWFVDDLLGVFTPGEALRFYDPKAIAGGVAPYGEVATTAVDVAAGWPLAYAAYGDGGMGILDLQGRQARPAFHSGSVDALYRDGDTLFALGVELTAWDVTQPDQPRLLATLPLDFRGRHVDPAPGGNLLLSTEDDLVITHWDGRALSAVGALNLPGPADRAVQVGGRGYVALHNGGLLIVDLADPAHPSSLVTLTSGSGRFVHDMLRLDDAHLLVSWEGGVDVLDIGSPASPPRLASTFLLGGQAAGIRITPDGKNAALALRDQGAAVLDLSDPRQPVLVGRVETPGMALAAALDRSTLYVADGTCGLRVFDVADPSVQREMGYWQGGYASDVLVTPDGSPRPPVILAAGSQLARLRYNPDAPAVSPPVPQSPDPPMDSVDAPIALILEWGPPFDPCNPLTYDVYFGQTNNPPLLGSVTGDPHIEVAQLAPRGSYFWRVEAVDPQGDRVAGPLWRFTTAGADFPNGFAPSPPTFLAWVEDHPLVSGVLAVLFVVIPGLIVLRGMTQRGAISLPRGQIRREDGVPEWYSNERDFDDLDQEPLPGEDQT